MTDETAVMAYVDGEVGASERAAIDRALPLDPELRRAVAGEQRLRRELSGLYGGALDEPVPDRLTRLLTPRSAANSNERSGWWRNVTAIAATLALGLFTGLALNGAGGVGGSGTDYAGGALERALDTQLASAQPASAPIQIGVSFVGPGGAPCRTFTDPAMSGLACRSDGKWRMMLVAPGGGDTSGFEYQQAASAEALVMSSAQELMASGPMDAQEERRARNSGWPQEDSGAR